MVIVGISNKFRYLYSDSNVKKGIFVGIRRPPADSGKIEETAH